MGGRRINNMENEKNFTQEILDNIKEHKISPRPRWQFIFKNYFIWTIGFLALFFGAVSISLIIFMLRYNEWLTYSRIGAGPIEFLLLVVPIFWILSLAIFIILVYFNFKNTKHGYRYKPLLIIFGAIIFSIILGCGFFALGMGESIDAILGRRAPLYDSLINPCLRFWSNAEAGRLSGLVVSEESQNTFILVDNNNDEWIVNYIPEDDKKIIEAKLGVNLGKALIAADSIVDGGKDLDETAVIVVGHPVRFLGNKTADKEFKAKEIVPFHSGRNFFYRFEKGHVPRANKEAPSNEVPNKPISPPKFIMK